MSKQESFTVLFYASFLGLTLSYIFRSFREETIDLRKWKLDDDKPILTTILGCTFLIVLKIVSVRS